VIDRAHIGRELPSHTTIVEAGRLRFFAKATGEDRPEYLDDAAAREVIGAEIDEGADRAP